MMRRIGRETAELGDLLRQLLTRRGQVQPRLREPPVNLGVEGHADLRNRRVPDRRGHRIAEEIARVVALIGWRIEAEQARRNRLHPRNVRRQHPQQGPRVIGWRVIPVAQL